MKKKSKKKRIIYHDPPMKYNIALHKFEPTLPTMNLPTIEHSTKNQVQINPSIIIILIIVIVIMFYLSYRIY